MFEDEDSEDHDLALALPPWCEPATIANVASSSSHSYDRQRDELCTFVSHLHIKNPVFS